jgi:hypothetical protein
MIFPPFFLQKYKKNQSPKKICPPAWRTVVSRALKLDVRLCDVRRSNLQIPRWAAPVRSNLQIFKPSNLKLFHQGA